MLRYNCLFSRAVLPGELAFVGDPALETEVGESKCALRVGCLDGVLSHNDGRIYTDGAGVPRSVPPPMRRVGSGFAALWLEGAPRKGPITLYDLLEAPHQKL